jgi:hypothetical protein
VDLFKLIETLEQYPLWFKWCVGLWIVAGALLAVGLMALRPAKSGSLAMAPAQSSVASSSPASSLGDSDEPFSIELVKRHGPPKANGERDIYMGVRIMSRGDSWIRGCRVRLVRVRQYVTRPDDVEKQDVLHIHPAYLRWPPGEGGGLLADFAKDATLDVAVIRSWAEPVYQLLTADESLRSIYQLEFKPIGPILTIEITAESGGRIERSFRLDGDFRLPKAGEEPLVRWVEQP